MREIDINIINKLTQAHGPIGHEGPVIDVLKKIIAPYVDEMYVHPLGSLVAIKRGNGKGKKLAIVSHIDEVGLMVNQITEEGYLRVSAVGFPFPACCVGQRVKFENGQVGVVAIDGGLAGRGNEDPKVEDTIFEKLYIDIGASSKKEAETKVKVGDPCVFAGRLIQIQDALVSKALDNRAGAYIMVEMLRELEGKEIENDLYCMFASGEELNSFGSVTATYDIEPDMMFAVDVTLTNDIPESDKSIGDVKVGKGPVVKMMDKNFYLMPSVKKYVFQCFEETGIAYQTEVIDFAETDVCSTQFIKGGILCGALSVGTRCVHTPVELMSGKDCMEIAYVFAHMAQKNLAAYL